MEIILIGIIVTLCLYVAAVYVVSKLSVDKLDARSGLFGAGIVTMFTGFVLHNIVEWSADKYWNYVNDDLPFLYYALLYGFLIVGLLGVVMIAVDLLKAINELSGYVSRVDAKNCTVHNGIDSSDKIPAWKRIQMEKEKK
jgi:hypothetical protein